MKRNGLISIGALSTFFVLLWLLMWLRIDWALMLALRPAPDAVFDPLTPGSFARLGASYLTSLYLYPWAGAITIAASAAAICGATWFVLRALAERVPAWACLLPSAGLVLLTSLYCFNPTIGLALPVALLLAGLYLRLPTQKLVLRVGAFLLLGAAAFCLAGGGAIIFAVVCAVVEFLRSRAAIGALCLLAAVGACWALAALFPASGIIEILAFLVVPPLYAAPLSANLVAAPLTLWAYFPLAAAVAVALAAEKAASKQARKQAKAAQAPSAAWAAIAPAIVLAVAGGVAGAAALSGRGVQLRAQVSPPIHWYDLIPHGAAENMEAASPSTQDRFRLWYHCCRGEWQQVLDESLRLDPRAYDAYVSFEVDRALYYAGRLPYDMFAYPQRLGSYGLLLNSQKEQPDGFNFIRRSDLWFDLGQLNFAERCTYEALHDNGENPYIYQRLVKINLLKGRTLAARTYLMAMLQMPAAADRARDYLRRLDDGTLFSSDPELARLSTTLNDSEDAAYGAIGPVDLMEMLKVLLRKNPKNRMAFEYLMGTCLLAKDVDTLVAEIGRLDDFDYPSIPPLYEEAIMIYSAAHPGKEIAMNGRAISQQTLDLCKNFGRDIRQFHNSQGAQQERNYLQLREKYGKTYLFYYSMGVSGIADPFVPKYLTEGRP